jgi:hypothetical protein
MMSSAESMQDAAAAWLDSLDTEQRSIAQLPWPSEHERVRWFYTPTDHGGLPLASMDAGQQRLALRVLATGLSAEGYATATTVMGLENVLDRLEHWSVRWGRDRGRDPQLYWLRVFGDPGATSGWSWRFGGHHISVQHTVVAGEVASSSPCFLGANPAETTLLGGVLLRPLGAAEDLARELMRGLTPAQRETATLHPVAPVDIVSGNRPRLVDGGAGPALLDGWRRESLDPGDEEQLERDDAAAREAAGVTPEQVAAVALTRLPKGLPGSEMSGSQQQLLLTLLRSFVARLPKGLAEREATKFEGARIDEVHVAWAGDHAPGRPHYYRLQGPRFLAEYDNTQVNVNHVHTVWRDPDGDFARDVLTEHLDSAHRRERP